MGVWGQVRLWALVLLLQVVWAQRFPSSWYQQEAERMRSGGGWGSVRGFPAQSRQSPPRSSPPSVSLLCQEEQMVVTVALDLFGTGRLVQAADLYLGNKRCPPTSADGEAAVFQYPLQECGNTLEASAEFLIYSSLLSYSPASGAVITRTNPASTPISCFYPRHANVSSDPMRPTWKPLSSTLTSEERLSFQLQLMTEDWSAQRIGYDFVIGEPMYLQASVEVVNHVSMRVLVDSCVAGLSADVSSKPQYKLIDHYGCLLDGKEDPSSIFISPRRQQNTLQFVVDAFRFVGSDQSTIYISCNLKAIPSDQPADATNKACSYSHTATTWSAVEGSAAICSCCESENCGIGQSARGLRPGYRPGHRSHWKREQRKEALLAQEVHRVSLGPLYIRAPAGSSDVMESLVVHGDSEQGVKPWMVAAVGGLWLVVGVGAVLTWRRRAGNPPVTRVQQ